MKGFLDEAGRKYMIAQRAKGLRKSIEDDAVICGSAGYGHSNRP